MLSSSEVLAIGFAFLAVLFGLAVTGLLHGLG